MNEPDLNHLSCLDLPRLQIPCLPAQWVGRLLLVVSSLFLSLMLAGAAFGFTDQNADLRTQALEHRERQRLMAAAGARNDLVVAQAAAARTAAGPVAKPAAEPAPEPAAELAAKRTKKPRVQAEGRTVADRKADKAAKEPTR